MPCIPITFNGTSGILCVGNTPVLFRWQGRPYLMEWHSYLGPMWMFRNGHERKNVPAEVWRAFEMWHIGNVKDHHLIDGCERVVDVDAHERLLTELGEALDRITARREVE